MPPKPAASPDLHVVIARITPAVLTLLGDGVPRSRGVITAALTDRHPRADVTLTLMRLAVTGQLIETGGKHTLPGPGAEQGRAVAALPGARLAASKLDPYLADNHRPHQGSWPCSISRGRCRRGIGNALLPTSTG
jgi:hypothetical protein